MYDQGRPMESLRLGFVDGLCFLGGILKIFGDKGQADGKLRLLVYWLVFGWLIYPGGKANIVHQGKDAGREEVATGQDRLQHKHILKETRSVVYHGQNRRSRCHPLRLKDKDIFFLKGLTYCLLESWRGSQASAPHKPQNI